MADVGQLAQFGETYSLGSSAADEDPTVVDIKVLDSRLECIRGDLKQLRPQFGGGLGDGVAAQHGAAAATRSGAVRRDRAVALDHGHVLQRAPSRSATTCCMVVTTLMPVLELPSTTVTLPL